jgi:chemotaxis protein CheZ
VTVADLSALAARLEHIHVLTNERIKELRADIAGGVELQDMSRSEVLDGIGNLLSQVTARASSVDVGGPGQEIEAVIRLNAEAANRIMDAAERISEQIDKSDVIEDVRTAVLKEVSAIFEACGFQDLTGQRIQRALKTLRSIEETMLGRNVGEAAPNEKVDQNFVDDVFANRIAPVVDLKSQAEIDELFR